MKKLLFALVFSVLLFPAHSHAAKLTQDQIQAVIGLLQAFNVEQKILIDVYNHLAGTPPVTAPKPLPYVAPAQPYVQPVQQASSLSCLDKQHELEKKIVTLKDEFYAFQKNPPGTTVGFAQGEIERKRIETNLEIDRINNEIASLLLDCKRKSVQASESAIKDLKPHNLELIDMTFTRLVKNEKPTNPSIKHLLYTEGGNCGVARIYIAVKDQYGEYMNDVPVSLIKSTGELYAVASTTRIYNTIPGAQFAYKTSDTNTRHTFTVAAGEYPTIAETFEVKVGESSYDLMVRGDMKYRFAHPKKTNVWVDENGREVDAETKLCRS